MEEIKKEKEETKKPDVRPEPEIGIGAGKRELKVGDDNIEIPSKTEPVNPPIVPSRETTPPTA